MSAALEVRGLRVELETGEAIVEDLTLSVAAGEILGIVGESGSGKTTTALALLGYAAPGVRIARGEVSVSGRRLDGLGERDLRRLRGCSISYVPQDPGGSLNPSLRIGAAVRDMLAEHRPELAQRADVLREALSKVNLPTDAEFHRRFPHQLSGGQQQRVCIATALVCEPPVVVLDEPTTGLDVLTQARILAELDALRRERALACVYVTHDLGVVAQIADRIAVVYAGRILEQGPTLQVLRRPRHPYTRGLLSSVPDHARPRRLQAMPGMVAGVGERPPGCPFAPRCAQRTARCDAEMPPFFTVTADHEVACLHWEQTPSAEPPLLEHPPSETRSEMEVLSVEHLRAEHRDRGEVVVAAEDVSFSISKGSCVALVGESGSGKTTIARTIVGLHPVAAGSVRLGGQALGAARSRTLAQHRAIQMIFQNPGDSLNPRQTVREQIMRPARLLRGMGRKDADAEASRLLAQVRLPSKLADRYPRELSGGERQRGAIARALAAGPQLIVCDEITSALDVSVQAAVLLLLAELRAELGVSLLVITHDLGVVASVADHTLVLEQGRLCEQGPTRALLAEPRHPYTARLLAAAPSVEPSQAARPSLSIAVRIGSQVG